MTSRSLKLIGLSAWPKLNSQCILCNYLLVNINALSLWLKACGSLLNRRDIYLSYVSHFLITPSTLPLPCGAYAFRLDGKAEQETDWHAVHSLRHHHDRLSWAQAAPAVPIRTGGQPGDKRDGGRGQNATRNLSPDESFFALVPRSIPRKSKNPISNAETGFYVESEGFEPPEV